MGRVLNKQFFFLADSERSKLMSLTLTLILVFIVTNNVQSNYKGNIYYVQLSYYI